MASLVADYGDSSDSNSEYNQETPPPPLLVDEGGGSNLLEADGAESGSGDEEQEEEEVQEETSSSEPSSRLPNPLSSSKLPPAALAFGDRSAGSVFSTSFHRAEEAKTSILQQHVKMTTTELPSQVAGKKICWNFRKGKCRFGSKCKYYHGNEIVTPTPPGAPRGEVSTEDGEGWQPPPPHRHNWSEEDTDLPDEDDYLSNAKRKKRAGVADTLVPPRKAMRQLEKLREQERPWTVHK